MKSDKENMNTTNMGCLASLLLFCRKLFFALLTVGIGFITFGIILATVFPEAVESDLPVEECIADLALQDNITAEALDVFINYVPDFETDYVSIKAIGGHDFKLKLKDTSYTVVTFVANNQVAAIINESGQRIYDAVIRDGLVINRLECIHSYETVEVAATYITNSKRISTCSVCGYSEEEITGNKISPISFYENSYTMDFLGGVTIKTVIKNNTDKVIKYVYFTRVFYNAVGDVIYSDLHNTAADGSMTWKLTGPLLAGESVSFSGTGFYNNTYKGTDKIIKYTVIFMDGTQIDIDSSNMSEYDKIIMNN